jgi:PAS domain S-box-containing protein
MHPDDQERFQKLFEKSVALKRGWHNSVICWLHKNGSVRYFESSARAIKDDEGHLTGFAGIDRDITKLSRVAEALER